MPDEGYGLPVGVRLQREDDFFGCDVGFQSGEHLRRGPAGLLGEDLRRAPRPFVGAAQQDVHLGHDPGETAGRSHEVLLALRRERPLAVVRPSLSVALVGYGVADEVEVHAGLPNARIEQGAGGTAGTVAAGDAPAGPTLDRAEIPLYLPVIRNRKLLCPRRSAGRLRFHAPPLTP